MKISLFLKTTWRIFKSWEYIKKPKHNFVIKWGFTITVCPQETCVCIWKPENLQQRGTDKHKHSPGKLSQLFWV